MSTSLDGPDDITDVQTGQRLFPTHHDGYSQSQLVWHLHDFLLDQRLSISIHAAVPPLDTRPNGHSLTADQYGTVLCRVLDHYVPRRREIAIDILDQMYQGVAFGEKTTALRVRPF